MVVSLSKLSLLPAKVENSKQATIAEGTREKISGEHILLQKSADLFHFGYAVLGGYAEASKTSKR